METVQKGKEQLLCHAFDSAARGTFPSLHLALLHVSDASTCSLLLLCIPAPAEYSVPHLHHFLDGQHHRHVIRH